MKTLSLLACIALSILNYYSLGESTDDVIVHLNHGPVRGKHTTGEKGNSFYSFRSIPFAEPPVGHLRFKPPVPKGPWQEATGGSEEQKNCAQIGYITGKYEGAEDCLYLNVYTPQVPTTKNDSKMDVLFHIHGGGFILGSGDTHIYGPGRLPLDEFVVVSPNYRLGALGFLSTEDSASPGNYGLLDQIEALRWVRNNIHRFGGDPDRVTILGESAGGASIVYLLLSPLSKGFFSKAVSMSGSPLCPWAHQKDPVYWAKQLATKLHCPSETSDELVSCLRLKSPEEIILNSEHKGKKSEQTDHLFHFTFTPTTDGNFIPDSPLNLLKEQKYNKVPIVIGATKDEGNCWNIARKSQDYTEEQIRGVLASALDIRPNMEEAIELVRDKYFSTLESYKEEDVEKRIGKAITHGMFEKCTYQTVKYLTQGGSPTYFYSYDYQPPTSFAKTIFNKTADFGVCHGEDLTMLFTGFIMSPIHDDATKQMKDNYQRLLVNFVKYGNPTPSEDDTIKWRPTEPQQLNRYRLNLPCSVDIYDESKDDHYKFWTNEIYYRDLKVSRTKEEL